MNKASLCRMVVVVGRPVEANGTDAVPAVITRVWSDAVVNLTAFRDIAGEPQRLTSIKIWPDEESARAWIAEDPNRSVAAYWPPRV